MPDKVRCETCYWWDRLAELSEDGYCRFNPPTVVLNEDGGSVIGDLPVSFDDWRCHHHSDLEPVKPLVEVTMIDHHHAPLGVKVKVSEEDAKTLKNFIDGILHA